MSPKPTGVVTHLLWKFFQSNKLYSDQLKIYEKLKDTTLILEIT